MPDKDSILIGHFYLKERIMSKTKTDVSLEEEERELLLNAERWNLMNPSYKHPISFWQNKLEEAKKRI